MHLLSRHFLCSSGDRVLLRLQVHAGCPRCGFSVLWTPAQGVKAPPVECRAPVKRWIVFQAAAPSPGVSYVTLAGRVRIELEVKHSKFIALAGSVESEVQALAFLSEVRDTRATHNCWAFKIGDRVRFSDDGEPGGTAGRPIHSAIVSSGLDRIVVVVIRYFGGIKLGTGGLVRAYGGVTSGCLKDAPTVECRAKVLVMLSAPYELLGVIYSLLHTQGAEKVEEEYDNTGAAAGVSLKLLVDEDRLQELEKVVKDSCRGRAFLTTSNTLDSASKGDQFTS